MAFSAVSTNEKQSSSAVSNVYIVAENRLLRETLVRLFRKRNDIVIVGDNAFSDSVVPEIASSHSDLLLMDCLNPQQQFSELVRRLRESLPSIRLVLFGMDDDSETFLLAVRTGVNGYVLKNASAAELVDAVRLVAEGEAVCPAKFCKILFQAIVSEPGRKTVEQQTGIRFELTLRQRQLMSLVAMGLSNKEIAEKLNLSEFTVKNHIYRVMKQLDAESRHEAVDLIRADGWEQQSWRKSAFKPSDARA